jgi:hypothetical protein
MPILTDEQAKILSQVMPGLSQSAASRVEAEIFIQAVPDYFGHKYYRYSRNQEALFEYLAAKKLPIAVDNLLAAYKQLAKERKLVIPPTPEQIERMGAKEIRDLEEKYPGLIECSYLPATPTPAPKRTSYLPQDYQPIDPKMVGYKPGKAEFAGWTAGKVKAWLRANDLEDAALPDYLKR